MSNGDRAAQATPRLTLQAAAAATAPVVVPVVLCELDFPTSPFRVWTGLGPLTWAGLTFEGVGDLGTMSEVEETVELRAVRLTLPSRQCCSGGNWETKFPGP